MVEENLRSFETVFSKKGGRGPGRNSSSRITSCSVEWRLWRGELSGPSRWLRRIEEEVIQSLSREWQETGRGLKRGKKKFGCGFGLSAEKKTKRVITQK
jgi:hypothetical protein